MSTLMRRLGARARLVSAVGSGRAFSTGVMTVYNKFDGSVLKELPQADQPEVDRAMATADRLFQDRSCWLPKHERIEILKRAAAIIHERRDSLALQAAREGGKPLVDSLVEIGRAADGVENCVEVLKEAAGRVIPMKLNAGSSERLAFTQLEPIGPVVAVSAFNHPFNLIVHQARGIPPSRARLPSFARVRAPLDWNAQ